MAKRMQAGWTVGACERMGVLLLAAWAAVVAPVWSQELQNAGAFALDNGVVRLEVMQPDHPQRYHTGARFTPLAAVLRATMAGHEFLFNPTAHDPVGDHAGLASEFDLCVPGGPAQELPPGYAEAGVGDGFLKIGVGVLQKQRQTYSLFQNCPVLARAQTTLQQQQTQAVYEQDCAGVAGYAYHLRVELRLEQNRIRTDWTLKNTGSKPLTTRQYCHNFLRFDAHDVGPGYRLMFPYPIRPSGLLPQQRLEENAVVFAERIPKWVNLRMEYPADYRGENRCRLEHSPSGLGVELITSLPGLYTAVHARAPYIAPEQFVLLALQPGEQVSWTRTVVLQAP